jgi:hypothetical protein
MPLPLVRWLSRPLARFLRFTWMSRIPLRPPGWSGSAWLGLRKNPVAKPETRPWLDQLGPRYAPQNLLGVLHSQLTIAGAPVLTGSFLSPEQVVIDGWVDPTHSAVLPASFSAGVTIAAPTLPEPAPGQMEALAALDTNAEHDSGGGACPPEIQPTAAVEPATPAQQDDFSLAPWLAEVGKVLNSPPESAAAPASSDAASTNGGGSGGGGSGAPGSGVNAAQPAAPLTFAASAPDARSAAQMTQPVAATSVMTSSGGAGAPNPVATGNGGGSQGSHAATPDEQSGSSSGS